MLIGTCAVLLSEPVHAQVPQVIENPRPLRTAGEMIRLATRPTVTIGTERGEAYEFFRIAGAARLADGRIVVADGGSHTLRFFDPRGTFLSSIGGQGGGPGEFRELSFFAAMPGDTLIAGAAHRQVSFFTPTGEYLMRRPSNPAPVTGRGGIAVTLAALDGSGTRVTASMGVPQPQETASGLVGSMPVTIVDGDDREIRQLGRLPSFEMAPTPNGPSPRWFGATAAFASGGARFYFGFGSEYSIRVYASDGTVTRIIRRAWTPVEVTDSDIETFVEEWGKRWIKTTGAEAAARRRALRADPYAETVPAFSQFIADKAGRLWVREANLADAPGAGALNAMPLVPSTWSVFDEEGRWLGDVTMPARFQPTDIGADHVLGTHLDADGVESVALYRLEP